MEWTSVSNLLTVSDPGQGELALFKRLDKMTIDLDLSVFHDGYKERIEALVKSKIKGEVVQVKEKRPKKPVAKSMMEVMETAESLK
jgi:non-homologous end joining protein Ku